MRSFQLICALFVFWSAAVAFGQSSSTNPTQASNLLQQSLAAQTGGAAVTDIILTGTVTFVHDKQTETGPMTLTAVAAGTTKAVFELPSGTRTETWSTSGGHAITSGAGPNGSSSQPAGGSIAMPSPAWFSPSVLTPLIAGPQYSNSFVGAETRNGASVQHLSVWQNPAQASPLLASVTKRQTQAEIYLDSSTGLPSSMVFQVRPYHKPGTPPLSIRARPAPEEVRFSNYQIVQGRRIPFHIQLFLGPTANQQQIMDLTISSVVINSGATITLPAAAAGN